MKNKIPCKTMQKNFEKFNKIAKYKKYHEYNILLLNYLLVND